MKISKKDIQLLKSNHRIELVMQEMGEVFEVDPEKPDQWRSTSTNGLTVDIIHQLYGIKKPGMEIESGDVIAWLQLRYVWDFGKAVTYLQKRKPDIKPETQAAKMQAIPRNPITKKGGNPLSSDYVIKKVLWTDPITGRQDSAFDYNYEIMDDLQIRALETAGEWVISFFSMSSRELLKRLNNFPRRFKQIIDFRIEKCASCEKRFNWHLIETVAYAQEESKQIDIYFESDDENLDPHIFMEEEVFIDVDFVICEKCARNKYAKRYEALSLVRRSARRREEAAQREWDEQQHQRMDDAELTTVIARRGGNP